MRRFAQFAKSGGIALSQFTGGSTTSPKVCGSVYVGVGSKATGPTMESILGLTVSLLDMPADRALPTAIARINRNQQDGSDSNRADCSASGSNRNWSVNFTAMEYITL